MMGWNEFVPPHFSISGLVAQLGEQGPYIATIQFYIWACSSVGERSVRIREVVGSTPIRSTKTALDELKSSMVTSEWLSCVLYRTVILSS